MMIQTSSAILLANYEDQKVGGSQKGRTPNLPRDFHSGYELLMKHYFSPTALYPSHLLCRRFRMSRDLFMSIVDAVEEYNPYFTQKKTHLVNLVCTQSKRSHQLSNYLHMVGWLMQTTSTFRLLKALGLKA
jgi:hypothetical protein